MVSGIKVTTGHNKAKVNKVRSREFWRSFKDESKNLKYFLKEKEEPVEMFKDGSKAARIIDKKTV